MKVSILAPVWNEAAHIDEMIQSVRNQTYTDVELIVVDDGSTDDTVARAERHAETDARIIVLQGLGKLGKNRAFNVAFAHAMGGTIMFIGGDDTLPRDSVQCRVESMPTNHPEKDRIVLFSRLVTMSNERRYDNILVPRARKGNRSGPTTCLSRALAEEIFPIDEDLVAEDLWISAIAEDRADAVIEYGGVTVNYRIHAGNSNPRHKNFIEMNEALHLRHIVYERLLARPGYLCAERSRARCEVLAHAEQLRYAGRTLSLIAIRSLPIADRASYMMTSRPSLFAIRKALNKLLMGRR